MIELVRPGVLAAGALFALVPVLLHLVARRPSARAALPTARFLEPEALSKVRLERRPTDLRLLALRVLFVLALAGAFAGPRRVSGPSGTVTVALLDASPSMAPHWEEAVEAVRALSGEGSVQLLVFDTVARRVAATPAALDSLSAAGPGGAPADLSVALRALNEAAAHADADSARARLWLASRRDAWTPGVGALREAWPGSISVDAFQPPATSTPSEVDPLLAAGVTLVGGSEAEREVLTAALEVVGVEPAGTGAAELVVGFSGTVDPAVVRGALEGGGTALLGPGAHAGGTGVDLPWRPSASGVAPGSHPVVLFEDGLVVRGAAPVPGEATPGARWLAATGDGAPAVVAAAVGEGCLVVAAFDPLELLHTEPALLPEVLARMLRGCAPTATADGALPLDEGALAVLGGVMGGSGGDGDHRAVPLAALRGAPPADRLLVRSLLLLALVLAALEGYATRARSARPRPGGSPPPASPQ